MTLISIGRSQGKQPLATVHTVKKDAGVGGCHPQTDSCMIHFLYKCVHESLSDLTHIFHRGDESVPFARNICLLVSRQDDLKDVAWGEPLSPLSPLCAHSGLSCDHMFVWTFVTKHVFMKGEAFVLSTDMYLSKYVYMDIWPNRHASAAEISKMGSVSWVKMSTTAYWVNALSLCLSSDVKNFTVSSTLTDTHSTSFLSNWNKKRQDGAQGKSFIRDEVLTTSLWRTKVRMQQKLQQRTVFWVVQPLLCCFI